MVEVIVKNYKSKKSRQRKHINTKKETLRDPIPGLEDVFFKYGAAHNVAKYKDTTNNLVKYAAINYKYGAAASAKSVK